MAIYNLISHAGSGKALNIYGTAQVSQNRNVCLWTQSSSSIEQQWSIAALSGNTRILSNLNTNYGLNVWLGATNKNNCDVHTVSDNQSDSLVTISTVSSGVYRIKLANYNLYLTAQGSADNSNVNWAAATSGTNQQWKAVTVGGVTPPSSQLTCPVAYTKISRGYWNNSASDRHLGIDYAAGKGTLIKAAADGQVIYVHNWGGAVSGMDGIGYAVFVKHSFGMSLYFHMNEKSTYVTVGSSVKRGDTIGRVGTTGESSGYHLHFGFKSGTSFTYNSINAYSEGTWKNPADYM